MPMTPICRYCSAHCSWCICCRRETVQ